MPILARTVYLPAIFCHHSPKRGLSRPIPSPTIATNRPPSASRHNACSTCLAPYAVLFLATRPPVALNGGFMPITVGRILGSSRSLSASPSTAVTFWKPSSRNNAARRGAISLTWTVAPMIFAQIASDPTPADGSKNTSPGLMFAANATRYASVGGVLNCWNASFSAVREVWRGIRSTTPRNQANNR